MLNKIVATESVVNFMSKDEIKGKLKKEEGKTRVAAGKVTGNACRTNRLLRCGLFGGLFPRRFCFDFRLHFSAYRVDLGFQSKFQHRLA